MSVRTFKYVGDKFNAIRCGIFLLPRGVEVVVDNPYIANRLAERLDVMEVKEDDGKKKSSPKENAGKP